MNVVLAGECGTGKSSLINLIVGRDVADTSNDTAACTTEVRPYKTTINGCNVKLWDTPGFGEGSRPNGRSSEGLVKSLHQLVQSQGEIHLVIYCMHGNRAKAALLKHYGTIRNFLPTVPIVAVVTRLERYQNCMEDWWSNNAPGLASHGMNFADHACITTVTDCCALPSSFRERLIYSQKVVHDLISRTCRSQFSRIKFPAVPTPNPVTRGQKDSGDASSQAMGMQIASHRVRATMHLRRIPTSLFV